MPGVIVSLLNTCSITIKLVMFARMVSVFSACDGGKCIHDCDYNETMHTCVGCLFHIFDIRNVLLRRGSRGISAY